MRPAMFLIDFLRVSPLNKFLRCFESDFLRVSPLNKFVELVGVAGVGNVYSEKSGLTTAQKNLVKADVLK